MIYFSNKEEATERDNQINQEELMEKQEWQETLEDHDLE